jgi:hypothetical protein
VDAGSTDSEPVADDDGYISDAMARRMENQDQAISDFYESKHKDDEKNDEMKEFEVDTSMGKVEIDFGLDGLTVQSEQVGAPDEAEQAMQRVIITGSKSTLIGSTPISIASLGSQSIYFYANGYEVRDGEKKTIKTVEQNMAALGAKLNGKDAKFAAQRAGDIYQNTDTKVWHDIKETLGLGSNPVRTDQQQKELDALQEITNANLRAASNGLDNDLAAMIQRLDHLRESTAATAAYGLAGVLGADQETQDRAAALGHAAGNVAMARATAVNGGPAYTGAKGSPILAPAKEVDPNKPYANSRPGYGKNQVEDVWKQAEAKSPDGKVRDPNTGEELDWKREATRAGQWDMGHRSGEGYAELHARYMHGELSLKEFLEIYRNPANYQPEAVGANRSRQYEGN